jgi:GNAT superfamily N-acetyltransferase
MSAFRKLLPTEMGRYRDHLVRLDREDRYSRFAGTVSDEVISRHCQNLDWHQTIIIGWFDQGELRGAAELRAEPRAFARRAELAFSVERPWQGRGIGRALLQRALTAASNRGLRELDVLCLLENRRMQALTRRVAPVKVTAEGDVGATISIQVANQATFLLEALDEGSGLLGTLMQRLGGLYARGGGPRFPWAVRPATAAVDAG